MRTVVWRGWHAHGCAAVAGAALAAFHPRACRRRKISNDGAAFFDVVKLITTMPSQHSGDQAHNVDICPLAQKGGGASDARCCAVQPMIGVNLLGPSMHRMLRVAIWPLVIWIVDGLVAQTLPTPTWWSAQCLQRLKMLSARLRARQNTRARAARDNERTPQFSAAERRGVLGVTCNAKSCTRATLHEWC